MSRRKSVYMGWDEYDAMLKSENFPKKPIKVKISSLPKRVIDSPTKTTSQDFDKIAVGTEIQTEFCNGTVRKILLKQRN